MEEEKLWQREPHMQGHSNMKDHDVFGKERALLSPLSVGLLRGMWWKLSQEQRLGIHLQ